MIVAPEAPLTQRLMVSNGLSVFVCLWLTDWLNSARTAQGYKHRYHHFWVPAGKHLSRVGFLGITKSQRVFDFTVPGSVSRILQFLGFSRFSQKVSSRSWGRFLWFCVFSDIKNKWLFSRIEQKWCRNIQISGLLRGPPAQLCPAGPSSIHS